MRSFLLTTLLATSVARPSMLKCGTDYVGSNKMGPWAAASTTILTVDSTKKTVTANIPAGAVGAVAWTTSGIEIAFVKDSSNGDKGSMVTSCKTAWYYGSGSSAIDIAGVATTFRLTPAATAGKLHVGYRTSAGAGGVTYSSIDIEAAGCVAYFSLFPPQIERTFIMSYRWYKDPGQSHPEGARCEV